MLRLILLFVALALPARAEILTVTQVAPQTWALVGPMEQRNAQNLGNNATFGLVATDAGAVLVDPGGSWQGAAMIHDVVRNLTDQPVTHVINTGGQDHRWLGNGYWRAQGATIIASSAAVADQQARASVQLSMLAQLIGDGLDGTEPAFADVTFDSDYRFDLGGVRFDIRHRGGAHTPGDAYVLVPARDTVFTGDIVYVGRILGVMPFSNVKSWIEAFGQMAADAPAHLVPGHGPATDVAQAKRDTLDYLVNLRARIGRLIDEGGDIMDAPGIDQSDFTYLDQFESLAGRNAQATFEQMEWE